MKVAVVGCGIAGSAAALGLARLGHAVTVFEQAPRCRPIGAGVLLQPIGQAALAELGLLDEVAAASARIERLHAHHLGGRNLVQLRYGRLRPDAHGLGVHRGLLFERLHTAALNAGVHVSEGSRVVDYRNGPRSVSLTGERGQRLGEFELVVAADGARSALAAASGLVASSVEYPSAAMWTTGPWNGDVATLRQIVDRSGRLVGVLPIGSGRASFFWGTAPGEPDDIRARGFGAWRSRAVAFEPAAAEILEPLSSFDEVTFASYRSVRLHAPVDGRMVFIGDAAHATSPHLGQGTGLALADARALCSAVSSTESPAHALRRYADERRSATAYYSRLTAFLTPFFQTDSRVLQTGRDLILPALPHIPLVGRAMLRTLTGEKRGWLR